MRINIERILKDIDSLSKFSTIQNNGCTRYSYSEEDMQAREYLINEMKRYDFDVTVDNIGNIKGLIRGNDITKNKIVSGSHIDTVYTGGKYDGILGVVSAIEVGRTLKENNISLSKDYEVIIFTEEEGSNFGVNLLGSKALAGKVTKDNLKEIRNTENISMYEMIKRLGVNPDKVEECKVTNIDTMIELHIEQANVLHSKNVPVGIVQGINALNWYEVTIKGESNHAGATPMGYRKDPVVEGSSLIAKLPSLVENIADDSLVATVGHIELSPNLTNVICNEMKFTIDLRGINKCNNDKLLEVIKEKLAKIEEKGFLTDIKLLTYAKETKSSPRLLEIMEEEALKENIEYIRMYSGSNHDTSIMAEITDVAMIFVPSVDGKSHCPEEFTKKEDIEKGCQLLLNTVYRLAK